MKNNSSKISREWAGVREDCSSCRLSPGSGQCTFQSASRGQMSPMPFRTMAGMGSDRLGARFSRAAWVMRRKHGDVARPEPGGSYDGTVRSDFDDSPAFGSV